MQKIVRSGILLLVLIAITFSAGAFVAGTCERRAWTERLRAAETASAEAQGALDGVAERLGSIGQRATYALERASRDPDASKRLRGRLGAFEELYNGLIAIADELARTRTEGAPR